MANETHTVMKKSLAKALIDAGMTHFDSGGTAGNGQTTTAGAASMFEPPTSAINTIAPGAMGGSNSFANQAMGLANQLNPIGQLFGSTQNQFQASAPSISTQNLAQPIQNLENQGQTTYGQQQSLAQQLLNQSQGKGPNLAQDQLNQTTGQNVAAQGALMASQRGASANPALMARQAAEQGAQTQQQAVGQAATLGAQQQLGAQSQLGSTLNNIANQGLQGQSILQGAQSAQNNAINQGSLGAQNINAQISEGNQHASNGLLGGIMGGASSAVSSLLYKGGKVKNYDSGGQVNDDIGIENLGQAQVPALPPDQDTNDFQSSSGSKGDGGSGGGGAGIAGLLALLSKGGNVPFSKGLLQGGTVDGKATVKGDSVKNDTVPTMLSPGEEVLPRSVTTAKDAPEKAKEFVKHLQKKDGEKPKGYEGVKSAKKSLKERVEHLEKLCGGGRI